LQSPSRRQVVVHAGAAGLGLAWSAQAHVTPQAPDLDGLAMADLVRRGRASASELVDDAIRRIETLNPKLNFVVTPMFDRARAAARAGGQTGPFAGVPFLVKDLSDVIGAVTRQGSRATAILPPATRQDPYIDAFQKAGLIFVAKSATPEFGLLPTTEPLAFGPTRNPWDLDRSAGGSSGGSAVAVAVGVVPLAHGSDGGGSIRMPAANCGVFGLKPSRGRLIEQRPTGGVTDLSVSSCLSRSVRDSAAIFAATERRQGGPYPPVGRVAGPARRRLKIGLVVDTVAGYQPHPEVKAAVLRAARLAEGLGHKVAPTKWPIDRQFDQDFLDLWALRTAFAVKTYAKRLGKAPDAKVMEPFTLALAETAMSKTAQDEQALTARLERHARAYVGWFDRFDVILSPVLATPPPPLGYLAPDVPFETLVDRLNHYVDYTQISNVAGSPAMSAPLEWTRDGLPVGIQFAARPGDEGTLFQLAFELEAAKPWARRRPNLFQSPDIARQRARTRIDQERP
jgi:amidase